MIVVRYCILPQITHNLKKRCRNLERRGELDSKLLENFENLALPLHKHQPTTKARNFTSTFTESKKQILHITSFSAGLLHATIRSTSPKFLLKNQKPIGHDQTIGLTASTQINLLNARPKILAVFDHIQPASLTQKIPTLKLT